MKRKQTFRSWQAKCKRNGLKVRLVTKAKTNWYYQAIHPALGIVDFFNRKLVK